MIEDLVQALDAGKPCLRYRAAKALRQCSVEHPEQVYPYFRRFVELMDGDNTILRWSSQRILGDLAAADSDHRVEGVLDRLLAPIAGHEMIGASNAIAAAEHIALAQPHLAGRIAAEFLNVRRAHYATPECREVVIGHALRSLDRFLQHVPDRRPTLAFARKQLSSPRPAARRYAQRLLDHWSSTVQPR